jgi:hypothetical protein
LTTLGSRKEALRSFYDLIWHWIERGPERLGATGPLDNAES